MIRIDRRAIHLDFESSFPYVIYSRHRSTIDAILDRIVDEERIAHGTRQLANTPGMDTQEGAEGAPQTGVDPQG